MSRRGHALRHRYGHARSPKTYRGWLIEPYEGTHVGYKLPGSGSLSAQIGMHTHRKIKGYLVYYPAGEGHLNGKHVDTLREAKEYIDNYLGSP